MNQISDFVEVRSQPTVVKLDHLQENADWIQESFLLTQDAQGHFDAILSALSRENGVGMFLIGHYGSGKSHFLAFLHQHLKTDQNRALSLEVVPISLLNFSSDQKLEDILEREIGIRRHSDRRQSWGEWFQEKGKGLFLLLDELSEFLRSKPTESAFHEDIRFLQFMGEWAQNKPFWIIGALQEQIEHTGNLSYELYRKIKDRFPLRFFLTPTHVKDIIAKKLLIKKSGYSNAIQTLIQDLHHAFPGLDLQEQVLADIYPIHPVTMELLEEVRSLFSEARGMIDFTVNQLKGSPERHISAFLEKPWGTFVSPDLIIDHFKDLLGMQGEFQKYSRQLFPRIQKLLPELFPNPALHELAGKLISCLVLVHLSPTRTHLSLDEALSWLLFKVTTVSPEKNRAVIAKVLERLVSETGMVKQTKEGFSLHFGDNELENLEGLIAQAEKNIPNEPHVLLDSLFNSFPPPSGFPRCESRNQWLSHHFRWFFHDRILGISFGQSQQPSTITPSLVVLLPWEKVLDRDPNAWYLVPEPIQVTQDFKECSALESIENRPMSQSMRQRFKDRLAHRIALFHRQLELSYQQARLYAPDGTLCTLRQSQASSKRMEPVLDCMGKAIFENRFPRFEAFAPCSGPVTKETYRQVMRFASQHSLTELDAPPEVRMVQEAYLVPMKLIQHRGPHLVLPSNLDKHELIDRLLPMLDHNPGVGQVYRSFEEPLYGLVKDQIGLMLVFLLHLGEIDILKGNQSYRDHYETLPNPILYDRIIKVQVLSLEQLKQFQVLCEGLSIAVPQQASNIIQLKKTIRHLKQYAGRQESELSSLLSRLHHLEGSEQLQARVQKHIDAWKALEKGAHELDQIQHFLAQVTSPMKFLAEHASLRSLPERIQNLVRGRQQLQHVLSHPCVNACPQEDIRQRFAQLEDVPGLENLDTLQEWLNQAQAVYQEYIGWYQEAHEGFWAQCHEPVIHGVNTEDLLELVRLPPLGLEKDLARFQESKRLFFEKKCKGISDLTFSPQCHCGFDGNTAPALEYHSEANRLLRQMNDSTRRFFQNPEVREKVRSWKDAGMDPDGFSQSYLVENQPFPRIPDLKMFREHLDGISIVQDVPFSLLYQVVSGRTWRTDQLKEEISGLLTTLPSRFRFTDSEAAKPDRDFLELLSFCSEVALRTGTPFPEDIKHLLEQNLDKISWKNPAWVQQITLRKLHLMNLGKTIEDQILVWLEQGTLAIPSKLDPQSPVRILQDWKDWTNLKARQTDPAWLRLVYQWHDRFRPLFGKPWLGFLNKVTQWDWAEQSLKTLLEQHAEHHWLVIDCLSLAMKPIVEKVLTTSFPAFEILQSGSAKGPRQSTTDGFYHEVLAEKWQKSFHKVNDLDELIHSAQMPFSELQILAAVKLEIQMKKFIEKEHPVRILVFSDHGFRLKPGGTGFEHSGGSNLERSFPFWVLGKK